MKSNALYAILSLAVGMSLASASWATPISWNIAGDGDFLQPANWNPPMVPSSGDDVFFQNGSSPTVSFGVSVSTNTLSVVNGNVVFDLAGDTYFVTGDVDVGEVVPGPLGPGALVAPSVSLTVNGGTLDAGGDVNVHGDAALLGDGDINTSHVVIDPGGQLRGSLTVNAVIPGSVGVTNSGAVAPGNSVDTITINGDYEQTTDGLLEIEVGGTIPGSQHDVLVVNGNASLAGRLDLPILPGYTPIAGHSINFLQSPTVSGSFDFISVPDLPDVGVAVQVVNLPVGVAANFVNTTSKSFAGGPGPHSWGDPLTWSDPNGMSSPPPTTTDVLTILNSDPLPQHIDVDLSSPPASSRAFAHSVSLAGTFEEMVLEVHEGGALSAISNVNVGELGRLELSGGSVYTNLVQVNPGGAVSGAGRIVGDMVVGTGSLGGEATFDPDYTAGATHVEQDLTLNSDSVLQLAIDDFSSFDQVVVDQTTTRGGRLVIDATNYVAPVGTQFAIMVSGGFTGNFDSIETVGSTSVFFATPPVAMLEASGPETQTVQSFQLGDMNLDNSVDPNDAPDFVLGLLDPLQYWATHGFMFPIQAGNFSPGDSFDFDDIQGFTDAVGALTAADIYALIEEYSVPEPTTGGLLLVCLGLLSASRRQVLRRSG